MKIVSLLLLAAVGATALLAPLFLVSAAAVAGYAALFVTLMSISDYSVRTPKWQVELQSPAPCSRQALRLAA